MGWKFFARGIKRRARRRGEGTPFMQSGLLRTVVGKEEEGHVLVRVARVRGQRRRSTTSRKVSLPSIPPLVGVARREGGREVCTRGGGKLWQG